MDPVVVENASAPLMISIEEAITRNSKTPSEATMLAGIDTFTATCVVVIVTFGKVPM